MEKILFCDVELPKLCLGTYGIAMDADYEKFINYAIEVGIKAFDTAEYYYDTECETYLGRVLIGKDTFIISKVHPKNWRDIRSACEGSLKRLKKDSIDLYLLHWKTDDVIMEDVCDQFLLLKDQGLIKDWGVSNFCRNDLVDLPVVPRVNQIEHNLINHDMDTVRYMKAKGIQMMAHSILSGGELVNHKLLSPYCKSKSISIANLALAWAQDYDCLPIMKISSKEHLYDAIKPLDINSHAKILDAFTHIK